MINYYEFNSDIYIKHPFSGIEIKLTAPRIAKICEISERRAGDWLRKKSIPVHALKLIVLIEFKLIGIIDDRWHDFYIEGKALKTTDIKAQFEPHRLRAIDNEFSILDSLRNKDLLKSELNDLEELRRKKSALDAISKLKDTIDSLNAQLDKEVKILNYHSS